MAERTIASGDARPIPPSGERPSLSRLLAGVDGELDVVMDLLVFMEWIESARYFVDTVRAAIENDPKLEAAFRLRDFRWNSASWNSEENAGFAYFQSEVHDKVRQAREQIGRAREAAEASQ